MSAMSTRWDALLGIAIGGVYTLSANCVLAQITPDVTLPNNSMVNINGNTIDITGGTQAGTNLFHSFQEFSVRTGSGAFFNNAVDIQNIVSRVTGGSISNIDGFIRANGTANLFLINPNGIVFGPNARLEIGGSFFASTASSLKFADGTEFRTDGTQTTPLLTISVPLGLQFGANPGKITVQGSGHNLTYDETFGTIRGDVPGLQVQPGRTLALVGGDIVLEGGNLRAESGRIELGSVASPGLVSLTQNDSGFTLGYSGIENFGNILLSQKASVDASGEGGGSIQVQSRQLSVKDGSSILSITSGSKPGGDFTVNATESVELIGESADRKYASSLLTESQGAGSSGNLTINTRKLTATDGAYVSTFITSLGDGGNLTVKASDSVELLGRGIFFGSGLYTATSLGSSGNAGELKVETRNLNVKNSARVFANSEGQGNAGDIFIQASDGLFVSNAGIVSIAGSRAIGKAGNINVTSGSVSLTDGARLEASTFGRGDAGSIFVQAKDSVSVARNSYIFSIVEGGAVGKGGDINITAATLSLKDAGQLGTVVREASATQPAGQGQAGNVNVNVTGAVTIAGVKNGSSSSISSYLGSGAIGKGGNINVTSGSLSLTDGAELDASTFGQGDAGSILVQAKDSVSVANSYIFSTVEGGAVGKGGDINITAATLSLKDAGQLATGVREASTTQPAGQGQAGNVNVNVTGAVTIAGAKDGFSSGILSSLGSGAIGKGGNINVTSGSFSLTDGAQLNASTFGQGDAGSILVQAKDSVSAADSAIFSNVTSGAVGKGGDININAATLSLKDGAILGTFVRRASANQPAGQGQAGNVIIDVPGNVSFDNSRASSTVGSDGGGKGGNIQISADSLSLTNGAELGAYSFGGDAGNVIIDARGNVSFDGNFSGASSTAYSDAEGKGGNIQISADSLSLTNGANLDTNTYGKGNAGNVILDIRGNVSFDGNFSGASSRVTYSGEAKGGNIQISADSLSLTNGAELGASNDGKGDAGNVIIDARGNVSFDNSRASSTVVSDGGGKGGNIQISADSLSLTNGASLDTYSFGGDAGNVIIDVRGNVSFDDSRASSTQYSYGEGKGGNIQISADSLSLTNGAYLSVSNYGKGDAGNIEVTAPQIRLDNRARFNAESESGNGGNINLRVGDLLLLRRGSFISATAGTAQQGGNGGNITINAPNGFIVGVPNENSDITANAFNGSGGKIDINSLGIFNFTQRSREDLVRELRTDNPNELNPQVLQTNDITAFSLTNPTLSGQVTINTPDADQSLGLVELPIVLTDTSNLIADTSCDAIASTDADTDKSKFTITGRGGLPPSPYEPLSSDVVWLDTRLSAITTQQQRSQGSAAKPPSDSDVVKIVPATGWVFDGKGNVTLISHASNANSLGSTPAGCAKK
ncbi:MAG: filamentous hemagglutinin N-terminal domain-containing protein [Scytonema hyalinum WJT4-NPBG1]|jgi:filamentous hemagglutinin family protein|nr:filamentous hemagglutinin N-terminal domain-containing protein [Scytonema hyalinum WJT4-NPBG1]